VSAKRTWYQGAWHFGRAWAPLRFTYDSLDGSIKTIVRNGDTFNAQVVDEAGLLDIDSVAALQRISGAVEEEVGVQVAVLVVPTLDGQDPEALAERVYQAWWIGRRQADHGLLLLYGADEGWWQLRWGPAIQPALDPVRVANATRVLGDAGSRPPGERLVEAVAHLARAAGASPAAVDRPFEVRLDWKRVALAGWILLGVTVVILLGVGTGVLQLRAFRWVARRTVARQADLLSLRDDGRLLRLRSRQPLLLLLVFIIFALPSSCQGIAKAVGEATRAAEVLTCSHATGRCEVSVGGQPVSAAGLDVIERLEVSGSLTGRATLLAATRWGKMVVVRDWPAGQVETLSARLGEFLADPAAPPLWETSETVRWGAYLMLGLVAAFLLAMGAVLWPTTFWMDRPAGRVALSGPFLGWHRPLGAVKAVRIERKLDVQVDRLRRRSKPMPYVAHPDLPARILLELEEAGARAVTAWFPGVLMPTKADAAEERRAEARAHLEATAGALAASLGVPLRPLREVPPPGTVPPPLDEGPAGGRPPDPRRT